MDMSTRVRQVPSVKWHDFLRDAIPSPGGSPLAIRSGASPSPPPPLGADGSGATGATGGAAMRPSPPPSVRAPKSINRCATVKRFTMPFSSNWAEGESSSSPSGVPIRGNAGASHGDDPLSATQLMALHTQDDRGSPPDVTDGRAAAIEAPRARRPRVVGGTEGVTLSNGCLAFDTGYEGWRNAMELTNDPAPLVPHGPPRAARVNAASGLDANAHLKAHSARLRAGPAQRATDDAHHACLLAAAASVEARAAANMAVAARLDAQRSSDRRKGTNPEKGPQHNALGSAWSGNPDPYDPGEGFAGGSPDPRRAKLRLLPL